MSGGHLSVAQGGQVCIQVVAANPLLYTYSVGTEIVAVPPPNGLSSLLGELQGALSAATGLSVKDMPARTTTSGPSKLQEQVTALQERLQSAQRVESVLAGYAQRLQPLLLRLQSLEDLRRHSDARASFEAVMEDAQTTKLGFADETRRANEEYRKAIAIVGTDNTVLAHLRALQEVTEQQFSARLSEFADAERRIHDRMCTAVESNRFRLSLTVASRQSEGAQSTRVVQKEVVSIEIDPRSDRAFEVSPGVLLGVSVRRSTFRVEDGIVRTETTNDLIVRPGLFAVGRLWHSGWLWAALGIAKGKDDVPDGFAGVLLRPSLSLVETQLSVGFGLGLYRVPDRLIEGSVGSPLPANVQNLDDNVRRKTRAGFAVTVSLSGLKLGETPQ